VCTRTAIGLQLMELDVNSDARLIDANK
jgi:hypothetical protein